MKYDFIREYAEGGFGKLDLIGVDDELYLLKTNELTHLDPEIIETIKKECQILQEMDHPNIIKCYGSWEEDNQIKMIIDYIDGYDIEWQMSNSTLSTEEILSYSKDIASALMHVKKKGYIHRDVKPANIVIDDNTNSAFLIDFGLAISIDDLDEEDEDEMYGTPSFMPPEYIEYEPEPILDYGYDIYSLGITMFFMFERRLPYSARNDVELFAKILSPRIPRISKDKDISDLVYDMMQKDPKRRITIEEAHRRLEGLM